MSDQNWNEIRTLIEGENIELGPYFGHQIRNSPRHFLFTLARYKFAAKMLQHNKSLNLLELGCSEGIGTLMLAENGHNVTAVDSDLIAINHANNVIKNININFINSEIINNTFGNFDAVISLDVIEHINIDDECKYMDTVVNNLNNEGMCIIGTPNDSATKYASKASQIGHINMYDHVRFYNLIQKYFKHTFLFSMNDEIIHTGFYPMAHYLLAVGCSPRRMANSNSKREKLE